MKKLLFLTSFLLVGLMSCQSQNEEKPMNNSDQADPGFQEINVSEFNSKMSDADVVILDVRTPEETAEGKIEGAMELNFYDEDFAAEVAKLDKDKTYLVYCRSGKRSFKACTIMAEQGFPKLYSLDGGYNAWSQQ